MNLVLGLFVPDENKPPIWELMTDYYLHHPQALGQKKVKRYFIYSVVLVNCLSRMTGKSKVVNMHIHKYYPMRPKIP
jgi:hypothetical protein